jgi:hypothetical protein
MALQDGWLSAGPSPCAPAGFRDARKTEAKRARQGQGQWREVRAGQGRSKLAGSWLSHVQDTVRAKRRGPGAMSCRLKALQFSGDVSCMLFDTVVHARKARAESMTDTFGLVSVGFKKEANTILHFCCSFVEISTKLQTLVCSFVALLLKFQQNCKHLVAVLLQFRCSLIVVFALLLQFCCSFDILVAVLLHFCCSFATFVAVSL